MEETQPAPVLVDTHCHLDMLGDEAAVAAALERASRAGVSTVITIGIDEPSSRAAVAIARRHAGVWAAVGIHPHEAKSADDDTYRCLAELAADPVVVAYGEIGMDLAKRYSPAPVQEDQFRRQLQLAAELDLPVVIHDREAHDQVLAIIDEVGLPPAGGVMHCFSGDVSLARQVLDRGLVVSIPGIVTFKNAAALQEVVRFVPLDRLVVETDAPFLAPVPFRGKPNEPAYVVHTARMVAELKETTLAEVARQTSETARRLFRLAEREAMRAARNEKEGGLR